MNTKWKFNVKIKEIEKLLCSYISFDIFDADIFMKMLEVIKMIDKHHIVFEFKCLKEEEMVV